MEEFLDNTEEEAENSITNLLNIQNLTFPLKKIKFQMMFMMRIGLGNIVMWAFEIGLDSG